VVDADHLRASSREGQGAVTSPAAKVEHSLARHVTTQAQLVVSRLHAANLRRHDATSGGHRGRRSTLIEMTFRPEALRGANASGPGVIDYRLARRALLTEYRKGRLARHQVCDAHPELVRAAREVGSPTRVECPVCTERAGEGTTLVLVTYVFGPRLPAHGRCITQKTELAKLDQRNDSLTAYVVEVCPDCHWHHLTRSYALGRATRRTR
jgi:hypothetical protein